ncbi:MAG: PEP-CTERM sorting domain-containing protein [Thermoguttaceae bacterium]|jgi:hypothetical protein
MRNNAKNLKLPCVVVLAAAVMVVAASLDQLNAETIALSNLPGSGTYIYGEILTSVNWEAVGLTTDTSAETFVSLVGQFAGGFAGGVVEGGIYSDSNNSPGTLLAAFNAVTVPAFVEGSYPVTTTSPYTMQPSTPYWFVLHDPIQFPFNWEIDDAGSGFGTVPTPASGYSFNGYENSGNAGLTWVFDTSNYAVQISTAAAVPEPGTLLLVTIGALGLIGCR